MKSLWDDFLRITMVIISILILCACQGNQPGPINTMDPTRQSLVQTRSSIQETTNQAVLKTYQEGLQADAILFTPTVTRVKSSTATAIPAQLVTLSVVTSTALPLPTATPVPTQGVTLSSTSAPTISATQAAFDWSGTWTAYFGEEIGQVLNAPLVVTVSGNTLTGVETWRNIIMTFSGEISTDGQSVHGTWSNPPASGNFGWYLLNPNQFAGNTDQAFSYCGSRGDAPMPIPCLGLVPLFD